MVVNSPLIRPYFLWGGGIGGSPCHDIGQSISEGPIILNHRRLIHGIHLSFQEKNFSGRAQTKRWEVLLTNVCHVQSQILSHGEAWDCDPNLPSWRWTSWCHKEWNTTCRPGSTNLVGLKFRWKMCFLLFLLQCILPMSPVQKKDENTKKRKTARYFTMDATPNPCTQLSSVPARILIFWESLTSSRPINPTNQLRLLLLMEEIQLTSY